LGGRFLGHRVDLRAKAGGDNSMPEKRGTLEDAKGAASQGPRDQAKAGWPESQSPAVEHAHPPPRRRERCATRSSPFAFRGLLPPPGQAMASAAIEGEEWGAYVTLDTFSTTGTRDGLTDASPKVTEFP